MSPAPKATLHRYLRTTRETLLWKLEGLSEYDVRRPLTSTGTNLLGVVKHLAEIEGGYFGVTFGRPCSDIPTLDRSVPNVDMYATADESRDEVIGWFLAAAEHADETIATLELDAPGRVPWWGDAGEVTLHHVLVHVVTEEQRHLGQVDVLRERIDGAVGHRRDNSNLDAGVDWPGHVDHLEVIARSFLRDDDQGA